MQIAQKTCYDFNLALSKVQQDQMKQYYGICQKMEQRGMILNGKLVNDDVLLALEFLARFTRENPEWYPEQNMYPLLKMMQEQMAPRKVTMHVQVMPTLGIFQAPMCKVACENSIGMNTTLYMNKQVVTTPNMFALQNGPCLLELINEHNDILASETVNAAYYSPEWFEMSVEPSRVAVQGIIQITVKCSHTVDMKLAASQIQAQCSSNVEFKSGWEVVANSLVCKCTAKEAELHKFYLQFAGIDCASAFSVVDCCDVNTSELLVDYPTKVLVNEPFTITVEDSLKRSLPNFVHGYVGATKLDFTSILDNTFTASAVIKSPGQHELALVAATKLIVSPNKITATQLIPKSPRKPKVRFIHDVRSDIETLLEAHVTLVSKDQRASFALFVVKPHLSPNFNDYTSRIEELLQENDKVIILVMYPIYSQPDCLAYWDTSVPPTNPASHAVSFAWKGNALDSSYAEKNQASLQLLLKYLK